MDFVVEWADDGLAVKRKLAIEEFDALILDLRLSSMDDRTLLSEQILQREHAVLQVQIQKSGKPINTQQILNDRRC